MPAIELDMVIAFLNRADGLHGIASAILKAIECEIGRGTRKRFSQLVRGIIAGLMEGVFGSEVEVKCIAKGDEYCEFLVRRRPSGARPELVEEGVAKRRG